MKNFVEMNYIGRISQVLLIGSTVHVLIIFVTKISMLQTITSGSYHCLPVYGTLLMSDTDSIGEC